MLHLQKFLKPSFSTTLKLTKFFKAFYPQKKLFVPTLTNPFSTAKFLNRSNIKQEIKFGNEGSKYQHIPNAQEVLLSFSDEALAAKCKKALDLYYSYDDINTFTKEQAFQICMALYSCGWAVYEKEPSKALEWFLHALPFGKKAEELPILSENLLYLSTAQILIDSKEYDQALPFCEESLRIYKLLEGQDNVYKAREFQALILMGIAFSKKELKGKALERFEKASKSLEQINDYHQYPEIFSEIHAFYKNISELYQKRGEIEKGIKYAKEGLDFFEKAYGVDTIYGMDFAWILAQEMFKRNRLVDALIYAKKCLNISKKINDITNISINIFYTAKIYAKQKKYKEALEACNETEENNSKEEMPKWGFFEIGDLEDLKTEIFVHLNHWKEAKECFDKALDLKMKVYDRENKVIGDCYYNAAKLWSTNNEYIKEAKEMYETALDVYRKTGVICYADLANAYCSYGSFLIELKECEEAVEKGKQALEHCKTKMVKSSEVVEPVYSMLGLAQFHAGQLEESIANLEEAARNCELMNNRTGSLYSHYHNLALAYTKANNVEKAEFLYKRSLEECAKEFGVDDDNLVPILEDLCQILIQQGKEEETVKIRRKIQELKG